LSKLEADLKALRVQILVNTNDLKDYLKKLDDRKAELSQIQSAIEQAQSKVAGDQLGLSSNYFGILGTLFAVAAALTALGGLLIYQVVSKAAVATAVRRANELIDQR
jgi:1,4-dihydroxy-2-naphthoate octaprenyltransferase